MKLAVIIPVGPGHERCALRAVRSTMGQLGNTFTSIRVCPLSDPAGTGRSVTRNEAMDICSFADWYFFLDADDEMMPNALDLPPLDEIGAVWGQPFHKHPDGSTRLFTDNIPDWETAVTRRRALEDAFCTGFFARADIAREERYNEGLDFGEDHEFFYRLIARTEFRHLAVPLVTVNRGEQATLAKQRHTPPERMVNSRELAAFWRKRGRIPLKPEEAATRYWA